MTWNDAKKEVLKKLIADKGLRVTALSFQAGKNRNFLTRVFTGERKSISDDEIDLFAPYLGVTVLEVTRLAQEIIQFWQYK